MLFGVAKSFGDAWRDPIGSGLRPQKRCGYMLETICEALELRLVKKVGRESSAVCKASAPLGAARS